MIIVSKKIFKIKETNHWDKKKRLDRVQYISLKEFKINNSKTIKITEGPKIVCR